MSGVEYELEIIDLDRCMTKGCDLLAVRRIVEIDRAGPNWRRRPLVKHCYAHATKELANLVAREDFGD